MHYSFHFSKSAIRVLTALALALLLSGRNSSAQETQERFEGWNLEPGVSQAHLVMVARVVSVSRVTVVEGAKTDVVLREYRFQPVRVLKGIFNREQLSMTASDLGLAPEDASSAPAVKEGELRLLILAQPRGITSYGCVAAAPGATTFEQRVPLLTGSEDPLVAVVETLIKVADSRSRHDRATLLIDHLANTEGVSAVPLLTSLKLRADWAAADDRAVAPLTRLALNPQPAVRGAALDVLGDMLASRNMPREAKQLDSIANALQKIIDSNEANTRIRLSALEALDHLLALNAEITPPRELLVTQLTGAKTYAERAAAATALSRIAHPDVTAVVVKALADLPLDEIPAREAVYARAAVRLEQRMQDQVPARHDPGVEAVLLDRLKRSMAARQSLEAEIDALGQMRNRESLSFLLQAANDSDVSQVDRQHIAVALGRLKDDQAVPMLIRWLQRDDYGVKESALWALENIDSDLAASEARPLLKAEPHLPYKLRIARLLARHGLADGYSLAAEHLSDDEHTAAATLVLAALDDPRTSKDLSTILASRPDRRWHAAALTGLAAIGDAAARKQLLEILGDDRNPLAADAAEAAGLADDPALLFPLAKLVQSRNKQIAKTSLVALRRFLSNARSSPRGLAATEFAAEDTDDAELRSQAVDIPATTRAAIAEAVASLVNDAYVDSDIRQEALIVARLLRSERYAELLTSLSDQAELESTPLLAKVQSERRRSPDIAKPR